MQAVICNADHPEWGCATIPFPIPDEEYANCMELLTALEIGSVTDRDCYVDQITGAPPVLDVLERQEVNVDELDFLARSIDRYTDEELAKFQSMAATRGYTDMTDLINLSFCCEQTTVITDFSDLESVGKSHYLATHGGGVPVEEYNQLNGEGIARGLIASGEGKITPYGVVYENGMELEQFYYGRAFHPYYCEPKVLDVEVTPLGDDMVTLLQLPMSSVRLDRMLQRGDVLRVDGCLIKMDASSCPVEVLDAIKDNCIRANNAADLRELNSMCRSISALAAAEQQKLAAVVKLAEPEYPFQIRHLAENLDLFDFVPGVASPEAYGKYMIRESGHYEFDENLDPYYDYRRYGELRIAEEGGQFNDLGYVSYHGTLSLDELMMEDPAEQSRGMQMGGMA